MNSQTEPALQLADLIPGDVMLSMGPDEISKLLAWNGDSDYSHGMLVCDAENLIEAGVAGVRKVPLAERIQDHDEMLYIDVFRAVDGASRPRPAAALVPVTRKAESFDGYPYALNTLKQLGIFVAIRNKLPKKPIARWVVRIALDYLMTDEEGHLTCTELLYRAYNEADTTPKHALRPKIVVQPASDRPFPKIRWTKLWREVRALRKRRYSAADRAGFSVRTLGESNAEDVLAADVDAVPETHPLIDERALQRQLDRVQSKYAPLAARRQRMLRSQQVAGEIAGDWIDPKPDPQAVIPVDFQTSPSYVKLGRLAMR